ncbi:DUF998 domain-containing protein [bacterium]|nr:DUF998 domain-containing protein [bacterium]
MEIHWLFLLTGLIAVIGDFVVPYLLGKKYPNYSNLRDTISTLGTSQSPVRRQLSYWLITTGTLLLIFSVGHLFVFTDCSWEHMLYILGLVVFGIGSILAGIFPEDVRGSKETVSGKIHGISSGLGFMFLAFNPLWMFLITENINVEIFSLVFFLMGIFSFVVFLVLYKKGRSRFLGLWQRVNLAILYLPLIVNYIVPIL